ARVAVHTAVLATAVRIQAEAEADVRAVVLGEDRAAGVAVEHRRLRRRSVGVLPFVGFELDMQWLVAGGGVRLRPAPGKVGPRHRRDSGPATAGPQGLVALATVCR